METKKQRGFSWDFQRPGSGPPAGETVTVLLCGS